MHSVTKSTAIYTGMVQVFVGGLTLFFLICGTPANADEPSDLQEELKRQQAITEGQQKAIDELKKRLPRLEGQEHQGEEHGNLTFSETGEDIGPKFGINLGVFGDINYSTKNRENNHHGFSIGDLDLYSTVNYGTRLNFLAELIIEMERNDEKEIDPERLWVAYSFSDLLTVRAGRQHSALGYWNKTYHHGRHLFLTTDRPFFLAFEDKGGILPVHIVGIELEGTAGLAGMRWRYELGFGNGPRIDSTNKVLVPNDVSDNNNSKQFILRLSARPSYHPDLTLGVFGTTYEVDTTSKTGLEELVLGLDLSYFHSPWEVISEYFRLRNSEAHSNAFYIQLGYNLLDRVTPYARYEYLNVDPTDPYFLDLQNNADRFQEIVGLRFDINYLRSSLKVQYRHDDQKGDKTFNVLETQWSFNF
jgi:hypothetical protein